MIMTDREKAIVMAYTGYTMLAGDKLGIFYHYVQEKLGHCLMTHELAYEEVQDAIQEAAKEDFIALAKSDNGWISVKDRLPKPNVSVLLAVYDREHEFTYRTVAWLNTSGDWDSNDDGFNQGDEDVLYWMPLPEPPEVEA